MIPDLTLIVRLAYVGMVVTAIALLSLVGFVLYILGRGLVAVFA